MTIKRQVKPRAQEKKLTKSSELARQFSKWKIPFVLLLVVGFALLFSLIHRDPPPPPAPDSLVLMEKLLEEKAKPQVLVVSESEKKQVEEGGGKQLPQVRNIVVSPPQPYHGVDLVAEAEVENADADPVNYHYRWFVNDEQVEVLDESKLPGDRFKRGDRLALEVVAYNSQGEGPVYRTADFVVPNAPPSIVSRSPDVISNGLFESTVNVIDPDGDPITFSLESAPDGMAINPETGQILWQIKSENIGLYTFRVVASDPQEFKAIQNYTLNFQMKPSE